MSGKRDRAVRRRAVVLIDSGGMYCPPDRQSNKGFLQNCRPEMLGHKDADNRRIRKLVREALERGKHAGQRLVKPPHIGW